MRLHISPGEGPPIYRQIVNQVRYLVASGRLKAGDALPPIRTLAQELLINPNTVARAYRELETMGVLSLRQGSGSVVAGNRSPLASGEKLRILTERVDGLLAESVQLGYDIEELVALVRRRDAALRLGGAGRKGKTP